MQSIVVNGEEVVMSTHAVIGPELIDPAARTKEEDDSMRSEVTPEVQKAIAEADPDIPHTELAAKFGISDVSVIK